MSIWGDSFITRAKEANEKTSHALTEGRKGAAIHERNRQLLREGLFTHAITALKEFKTVAKAVKLDNHPVSGPWGNNVYYLWFVDEGDYDHTKGLIRIQSRMWNRDIAQIAQTISGFFSSTDEINEMLEFALLGTPKTYLNLKR